MPPLLSIHNLRVSLESPIGAAPGWVLRGLSLELLAGERVALVGESGCGKSVTALTVMDLLPSPPMVWREGSIRFKDMDLKSLDAKAWRKIRGAQISMVFQDPFSSLNPVFTVGDQLLEALEVHETLPRSKALERVDHLLREVGLPEVERLRGQFPHQLSGGMCQRVMIAMAVIGGPSLLIADEPTTALDVTVQGQILEMLFKMTVEHRLGLLFITHNLPLVRDYVHRIMILYAGQIVEQGTPDEIFTRPRHPYTAGLLEALPDIRQKGKRLYNIPGQVPSPFEETRGCGFAPRCPKAQDRCRREAPGWETDGKGHGHRCFYPSET